MWPEFPCPAARCRSAAGHWPGRPHGVCASPGWALKAKARPAHAPGPLSWVVSKVTGQRSGGQAACRALGSQCASCARASARRSGLPAARRGLGRRQLPSTDVGHSRRAGTQAGRRRPARRNLTVLAHGILPNPAPGLPARGKPGQSDPLGHHLLHGAGRQRCALSPAPHLLRAALYLPPARLCHCARATRIAGPELGPVPAAARVKLSNCCDCAAV